MGADKGPNNEILASRPSALEILKKKKGDLLMATKSTAIVTSLEANYGLMSNFYREDNPYILGDYGSFVDPDRDYEYEMMFSALGIKDTNGEGLDMQKIRKMGAEADRGEKRNFNFSSENGEVEIIVDFFSPGTDINFATIIKKIDDEGMRKAREVFETSPTEKLKKELLLEIKEKGIENINKVVDITAIEAKERDHMVTIFSDLSRGLKVNTELSQDGENLRIIADKETLRGESEPMQFIESNTVKELFRLLDLSGLELSPRMEECVMEFGRHFSRRYGNGFAEMFRQLGYLMNPNHNDDRNLEIFSNYDSDKVRLLREIAEEMWEVNPAVKLWVAMVEQMCEDKVGVVESISSFDYFQSDLGLKGNGACEDGDSYLVMQHERKDREGDFYLFYNRPGSSDTVYEDFLMAMTIRWINVQGVMLPPGYFCRLSNDGKSVEPIRPSIFVLDEEDSRDGFGCQFDKVININGSDFVSGRKLVMLNSVFA